MRGIFPAVACVLLSVVSARADAVIDDFRLTGPGTVITFSLPASPKSLPSYGAGGADAGFFPVPEPVFTVNGVAASSGSIEFLSGKTFVGPGLILNSSLGSYTLIGKLLYTGTSASPAFLTGSFDLHNFYGAGTPAYVLTITPEATGTTPEPGSLTMLLTGGIAVVAAGRRRFRRNSVS